MRGAQWQLQASAVSERCGAFGNDSFKFSQCSIRGPLIRALHHVMDLRGADHPKSPGRRPSNQAAECPTIQLLGVDQVLAAEVSIFGSGPKL